MTRFLATAILGLVGALAVSATAHAQAYIGYAYPAGGQQGTTVKVRLGGQRIDGVESAVVTGTGVEAKVTDYYRYLSNQEMQLLREQQRSLTRGKKKNQPYDKTEEKIVAKLDDRLGQWINTPANRALANLAFLEVTIAPDAEPGPREIRLVTRTGVTNPLPFYISQFPEVAREPMSISPLPVLGKEELAERNRPASEQEKRVSVPCVCNGQVAAGEINHYRFDARKGQRLVISTQARSLVPYIADAVPGWFQPVLTLYNQFGKEVAYNDDYRFEPDPVMYYEVQLDGEYVLTISDAIFRGREDFVYRVTIAEQPFVTSIFPLGGRAGEPVNVEMKGWNLDGAQPVLPTDNTQPGVVALTAVRGKLVSNQVPFEFGTLPETREQEPNGYAGQAQEVSLPVIVNGRVEQSGDWDTYQFKGRAGQTIVAEVTARRLDSPLDSILKLTDAKGALLALNDDYEDPGTGLNTHHADSYIMFKLPADGTYVVHLGDTAQQGGEAYAYRLRLSGPQPYFGLRVVPSAVTLRTKGTANVSIYPIRRDGFAGDITVSLKNPPEGISAKPVIIKSGQEMVRMSLRTTLTDTKEPLALSFEGKAAVGKNEVAREAVGADDWMQAFLWRHLVPAEKFQVRVYNPSYEPPPTRVAPPPPPVEKAPEKPAEAPKFTKGQVAGRLRQLKSLYEEWLLTDDFYHEKVAECQAAQ